MLLLLIGAAVSYALYVGCIAQESENGCLLAIVFALLFSAFLFTIAFSLELHP